MSKFPLSSMSKFPWMTQRVCCIGTRPNAWDCCQSAGGAGAAGAVLPSRPSPVPFARARRQEGERRRGRQHGALLSACVNGSLFLSLGERLGERLPYCSLLLKRTPRRTHKSKYYAPPTHAWTNSCAPWPSTSPPHAPMPPQRTAPAWAPSWSPQCHAELG